MLRTVRNTAFLCALTLGAFSSTRAGVSAWAKPMTVDIKNADGRTVGTATLSQAPEDVKITLDIKNLPPGAHLLHIHQFPKCEPPDFKSAGPPFDPENTGHGEHAHTGLPAGDIPNFVLTADADGTAHTCVITPNVTMGTDSHSVFSNGGTSIVIHAVADKVTAAAPPRIACAVITKPD